MGVVETLEYLLDAVLDEYDSDCYDDAKETILDHGHDHLGVMPQSLNPYSLLAYDLYCADENKDMESTIIYAIGMVRENDFQKLKTRLPDDIDPLLPGAERLSEDAARKALVCFENEARFDLAARMMLLRKDVDRADAYRTLDSLQQEAAQWLKVYSA
jgi:hypothetical protein